MTAPWASGASKTVSPARIQSSLVLSLLASQPISGSRERSQPVRQIYKSFGLGQWNLEIFHDCVAEPVCYVNARRWTRKHQKKAERRPAESWRLFLTFRWNGRITIWKVEQDLFRLSFLQGYTLILNP